MPHLPHAASLYLLGRIQILVLLLPDGNLLLRLFLADSIGFLDLPCELIALTRNLVEIVVGEVSPLLLLYP
jgi:hypothetical protein